MKLRKEIINLIIYYEHTICQFDNYTTNGINGGVKLMPLRIKLLVVQ